MQRGRGIPSPRFGAGIGIALCTSFEKAFRRAGLKYFTSFIGAAGFPSRDGTVTPNWRLHKKLQQFVTEGYKDQRTTYDSKGNI